MTGKVKVAARPTFFPDDLIHSGEQFSSAESYEANPRSRAASQRWSSPAMRTDDLDATTGDIQLNLDSRAT
jgi:hypothetical protein